MQSLSFDEDLFRLRRQACRCITTVSREAWQESAAIWEASFRLCIIQDHPANIVLKFQRIILIKKIWSTLSGGCLTTSQCLLYCLMVQAVRQLRTKFSPGKVVAPYKQHYLELKNSNFWRCSPQSLILYIKYSCIVIITNVYLFEVQNWTLMIIHLYHILYYISYKTIELALY